MATMNTNAALVRDLLEPESRAFWREDDLGALLRHELAAPVQVELSSLSPAMAADLVNACAARGLLLRSFDDLFKHPAPPVELLTMVKRFAKASRVHPDSPLPPQIANVLYYASIAAALVRCGRRISDLDDESLRQGFDWCAAQPWVEPALRALVGDARPLVAARPEGPEDARNPGGRADGAPGPREAV